LGVVGYIKGDSMPDQSKQPGGAAVDCVICNNLTWLHEATAGSLYTDGRQAFACTKHIQTNNWPLEWALFEHDQLQKANI
jgi:hypothetical protein